MMRICSSSLTFELIITHSNIKIKANSNFKDVKFTTNKGYTDESSNNSKKNPH